MATNDIHMHSKEESCGMCEQRHWMHVIIRIAVALLVFWAGVQFGELRSILRSNYGGYGYSMMNSWGERNQGYYGSPTMMGGWTYATAPTPSPAVATTTKKK